MFGQNSGQRCNLTVRYVQSESGTFLCRLVSSWLRAMIQNAIFSRQINDTETQRSFMNQAQDSQN